jgi:MYXO-CTERM domain-containing protein
MTLPRSRIRRFAVAASTLCIMAVASDAGAFCREVTATAPAGYDPVSQGCFGADAPGIYEVYWKNLCVGYSLQRDASSQVTLDQATQIAAQAFAAWSAAPCGGGAASITAVDEGPVDCGLVQYNDDEANQHVIVFRDDAWPYDDSSNTLGLTTVTFDVTDGEIFDADMEINSHDYTLSVDGADAGAGSYDLLSIMTHEAGHFLGLAHSADPSAMMFAHYESGATTLTADDIIGICTIDPSDGTRTTSSGALPGDACDPTPRHGFSTACNAPSSDDGGTDGETGSSTPGATKSACSVGRPGHAGRMDAGMVGLAGLSVLVYRRRRRDGIRRR